MWHGHLLKLDKQHRDPPSPAPLATVTRGDAMRRNEIQVEGPRQQLLVGHQGDQSGEAPGTQTILPSSLSELKSLEKEENGGNSYL